MEMEDYLFLFFFFTSPFLCTTFFGEGMIESRSSAPFGHLVILLLDETIDQV
jgi:hypothetical protein